MADPPVVVASAVIVPETTEQPTSPTGATKRRQSSISENIYKRPRLSGDANSKDARSPPLESPTDRSSERRRSGQVEERKRGQRLFGALLGTLSQSSSSTAQKRRTDIEKKQQAKLKLQADEVDEKKKQRSESLLEARRAEQIKYDKGSMQIRHSNLRAQANFLQTKTEPKLFYKPWEPTSDHEAKIKSQIKEAEEIIEREISRSNQEATDAKEGPKEKSDDSAPKPKDIEDAAQETVGEATDIKEQQHSPKPQDDTNAKDPIISDSPKDTVTGAEIPKDQHDDGGEVVEGDEDTVMF